MGRKRQEKDEKNIVSGLNKKERKKHTHTHSKWSKPSTEKAVRYFQV